MKYNFMKPKVLIAMSGGVDSSVAALILKKQGYDVIGAFMKNFSHEKYGMGKCKWKEERDFAIKIAAKLKIPLLTFDFEKEYSKQVIDKMFKDYKKGITPNPDIDCNEKIKFPLLLKAAKKLNAKYLVTGHFAKIKKDRKGKYNLLRAKDESKDQSYFLYRLKESELKKCIFPIGDLTKTKIRKIAKENNFINHDKKSTVGICFIGKINLKDFLKKKIKPKKGNILDPNGEIIGQHDGVYYYTIGQRLGPRYGFEVKRGKGKTLKRWYVARKDIKKNIIIAAPENHPINFRKTFYIKNPHFITEKPKSKRVLTRIRQVGELLKSKLEYDFKLKLYKVTLKQPITGISQGQAIVLYKRKKCLGGGEIYFK
jgi:tRNA-uridine 2-sulfurtransferase